MSSSIHWILLANSLLASILSGVATRIFYVAMPTVAHSLQTDILGVSWAILVYQLASIGLSLIFGKIGDLYGHRIVLGGGYIVMMIGSLLCGLSANIGQLIGFRFLQGTGAAMTQSVGRAVAAQAMPEEKGGRAQGLMTTAFHSGVLLGPGLGGLIIDYVGWRWTFFLLVPLSAVGTILSFLNMERPQARSKHQAVDYLGAALFVLSASTLLILLDRRSTDLMGLQLKSLLALLFAGSFLGFFIWEGHTPSPMVNLTLFKIRMFVFSAVSLLVVAVNYSVCAFILPFYLQGVLQLSPSFIGTLFMVAPIFTVTLGPISGYICDRVGPRLPATTGASLLAASLFLGTFLKTDSDWILPALIFALLGLANGFFNPANSVGVINSVPKEHMGFASGTQNVMFGVGNIFGITLASFLMTSFFQKYTGISGEGPDPAHPDAFVAAVNYTFLVGAGIGLVAMMTSAMRGVSPDTKKETEVK